MWPEKTVVPSKATRRCNKNRHPWILVLVLVWMFLVFVFSKHSIYTAIISQRSVEKIVREDEEFFKARPLDYQQQPPAVTTIWKDVLEYQEETLLHLCKSQHGQIFIICIECGQYAHSKLEQICQREPCRTKMRVIYPKQTPQQVSEFKKRYIHLSINPEPYEMFCFMRHFYILEALRGLKLESAFIFDSDMVFFDSLINLLPFPSSTLAWYSIFMVHWDIYLYFKFTEYISSFYNKPMGEVAQFIKDHIPKTDFMFRIPDSYQAMQGQLVPKFSDMEIFGIFVKEFPGSMKFICPDVSDCPRGVPGLLTAKTVLDCYRPPDHQHGDVSWVYDLRLKGYRPLVNDTLLFGVHLQGPECKDTYLRSFIQQQ